jgi:hypothetical protein
METREEQYTVMVPHVEQREIQVPVCRLVERTVLERVAVPVMPAPAIGKELPPPYQAPYEPGKQAPLPAPAQAPVK